MLDLIVNQDSPTVVSREQIMALEEAIKTLPQIDFTEYTKHHFAPGVYVRELFMPEGTVATGKIHRFEAMNILLSGTVRITTDEGVQTLTAPQIFNSKAGTKKAAFALTDVRILNIHPTHLTDIAEIEREHIAPDFAALEQEDRKCLG